MPVKKSKPNQYHISNMHVTRNGIRWETHIVRAAAISQAWVGPLPARSYPAYKFLVLMFVALSAHHLVSLFAMAAFLAVSTAVWIHLRRSQTQIPAVQVMLHSGHILSFTADGEALIAPFYEAVKQMADGSIEKEFLFDANGNLEEPFVAEPEEPASSEEPEEPAPKATEFYVSATPLNPLAGELQRLHQSYADKTDTNEEILLLINEATTLIEAGDRESVKASYRKFVTMGLIQDCNELGLYLLIQEIKNAIY